MRTKTLLLTAAMAAGAALSGMAQTVYSVNAVGYVNLAIPQGWSMIANPLNTTNNTIEALFSAATTPEETTIYKWDGTKYVSTTAEFGDWSQKGITLNPGEGCFMNAKSAFTNTFVGEVMQGALSNALPVGFSIRGSMVPQAGTATELGLTASVAEEDTIYQWTGATYKSATYEFGAWSVEPNIKVGEAFWMNKKLAGAWVRNFSVNTP